MKCVWMLAGVVDYKLCSLNYDCECCEFDRAIRGKVAESACGWRRAPDSFRVRGYEVSESLFYVPGHVWGRVEARGRVRIGLDDFGQKLVGRIYAVALPAPGTRVGARSRCWRIVHRLGESVLRIPVTGVVCEVNDRLIQQPSLANRNPYGNGGAMLVEPRNLAEFLRGTYYGDQVESWYRREIDKLETELKKEGEEVAAELGPTLPDGGDRVEDFRHTVSPERLRCVIDSFLSAGGRRRPRSAEG